MSVGLFTDKTHHPADEEIHAAVGPKLLLWQTLVQWLREHYAVQEDVKFLYGKTYGWARRFQIKKTVLTSLYPTQGGFTVQVNLRPEAIEAALRQPLGDNVQQAIARANPYPEGRWLFIPVESENDLRDVQQLIAMRIETRVT